MICIRGLKLASSDLSKDLEYELNNWSSMSSDAIIFTCGVYSKLRLEYSANG